MTFIHILIVSFLSQMFLMKEKGPLRVSQQCVGADITYIPSFMLAFLLLYPLL